MVRGSLQQEGSQLHPAPLTSLPELKPLSVLPSPSLSLALSLSLAPRTHRAACEEGFVNWGTAAAAAAAGDGKEAGTRPWRQSRSMNLFPAFLYLLPFLPALALSARQGYEELEKQLKEVFLERSNILRQLSKTSKELEGIKVNLQSLKNDKTPSKSDVQNLLALGQKQREEMQSLQENFKKQLNEAAEKAEKQQATINFLKTEMERKSKMIRDLQNENKSLKNKLLSGNKLCGIHAEESKKIQAQLKDLRYGKKDLLFKAQQLSDLEQKLAVAKNELDKAALDKDSQLKALKETVQVCLSSVLHKPPPTANIIPSKPSERLTSHVTKDTKEPLHPANTEARRIIQENKENLQNQSVKKHSQGLQDCDPQEVGKRCIINNFSASATNDTTSKSDLSIQKLHGPPWIKAEEIKTLEHNLKNIGYVNKTEGATL